MPPCHRSTLADRPARSAQPSLSVGEQELAAIERSARLFRSWDDHFGGGLRRKAVIGQLNEVADILPLPGAHPEPSSGRGVRSSRRRPEGLDQLV
jgi:hypothetical protein